MAIMYHEDTARCDFNWQPRDLVAGLMSKAVSPYTLVVGVEMHKDRSLPWMRPSLFIPLAALLHQYQAGTAYRCVTRNDLVVFNVLGFMGGLSAVLAEGVVPSLPEPPMHPPPLAKQLPQSSTLEQLLMQGLSVGW
ncbi:uncharacterized protein HaLaN_29915 [Haematococcus lacustris]|uniref:Uncharacterized protein n=1 Tax=Haematococcus lacustris TaxID=44745 RepID=A0A6A0AFY6_HAELA|nr:uncharacterized protein HaLaN_29915 [Haematococcus lacustris]